MRMLTHELRAEPYNKTAHRRELLALLDSRSAGAVERKHQNISAVLIEAGFPYIDGYKPLANVQELLRTVVLERLRAMPDLRREAHRSAVAATPIPTVDEILSVLEKPPTTQPFSIRETEGTYGSNVLRSEALNSALGEAGEQFTLRFEQARLSQAGADPLAAKVEQVSATRGDSEGFDILSFEIDGRERLIEVKTTGYGKSTPFFVSSNQVRTSARRAEAYCVYRLFRFRRAPGLFILPGSIEQTCFLEANEFRARPR